VSGEEKILKVVFFKTDSGAEPVRQWLLSLSREERLIIGIDIKTVEFSWPVGMPTCKSMGEGLWEVRSNLPQGKIARALFCVDDGYMVLLHGFIKKSKKTPPKELDFARRRKRQWEVE